MKTEQQRYQALVDGTPHERSVALYAIAATEAPGSDLLSAVESLLDERAIVQMYVPYRYGQLRYIAADALAQLRARVGDMRPIHLAELPVPLNVDRMGQIRSAAGLVMYTGEPAEEYADLVARGLVRVVDRVFDPAEYLDDDDIPPAPQ